MNSFDWGLPKGVTLRQAAALKKFATYIIQHAISSLIRSENSNQNLLRASGLSKLYIQALSECWYARYPLIQREAAELLGKITYEAGYCQTTLIASLKNGEDLPAELQRLPGMIPLVAQWQARFAILSFVEQFFDKTSLYVDPFVAVPLCASLRRHDLLTAYRKASFDVHWDCRDPLDRVAVCFPALYANNAQFAQGLAKLDNRWMTKFGFSAIPRAGL